MFMNTSENSIDQLTQEMENAIDSLFMPMRQIEIDPLTNEIKKDDATRMSDATPLVAATIDNPSQEQFTGVSQSRIQPTATNLSPHLQNALRELQQSLMTIEWEMSVAHIQNARRLLNVLSGELTEEQIDMTQNVRGQIADILVAIETISLNRAPGNFPELLLKLFDVLEQILKSGNMTHERVLAMLTPLSNELNKFFEQIERVQQEATLSLELDTATDTAAQTLASAAVMARDLQRPSPPQYPSEPQGAPETGPSIATLQPVSPLSDASPVLQDVIGRQIRELTRWMDRLSSLEKILSGVPAMEKLLAFHGQLKQEMAAQERFLRQSLNRPLEHVPESPTASAVGVGPAPVDHHPVCPWRMLVRTEWWGKRIAFPQEYIAFEGKLPWGRGQKLLSKDIFYLNILKKWPWSGIRSLLTGRLSSLEEGQLKTMALPILVSPDPPPPIIITEPTTLILWNAEISKGCVILADNPTIPFKTDAWTWEDAPQKPFFAGRLRKNEDEIYVLSQDIFS